MPSKSQNFSMRHPLQRLPSPSRGFSAAIHLTGITIFTLCYKYLIDYPTYINTSRGWHFQYLTIIGLTIACLTFIVGLLADLSLSPRLFYIKNTLSLCSTPLEVLISLLYWGISAIDKKLLVPPGMNISPWADVGFHAMPSLLLTVDLLFLSPPWTINRLPAAGLSSVLAVSYWAWVEYCYQHNGFYPYPLFEHLDTQQRSVLFGGAALLMTGSTVVLQWLYSRVNGIHGADRRARPGNVKGD